MALFDNLFGTQPEYLQGLLGEEQTQKLRDQALKTGLVNSAIALIAQPRNQRYGSALPYIGRALMAGQQAGQNVYDTALQGYEMQQKLAEIKRQQDQRKAQEDYINTLPENVRATLRANPTLIPEYAKTSVIPKERKYEKIDNQLIDVTEKPTVAYTAAAQPAFKVGQTRDFIQGTQKITQEFQPDGTWKQIATGSAFAPPSSVQVSYGSPVAGVDAQGNPVFFQPSKEGGVPAIVPGVRPAPKDTNVTADERKAATLLKRMEGSLSQLENVTKVSPEAQKPGIVQSTLRGLPFGVGEATANIVTPQARQRVESAQLDIVDAALTLGTGAAYTKEQLEGYRKSYFPQIGDSKETISDKQDRLNNLLEAARIAAGKQQIISPNAKMPNARNKQDILKQYGVQ